MADPYHYRRSYVKTVTLFMVISIVSAAALALVWAFVEPQWIKSALGLGLGAAFLWALWAAASGLLVLYRDKRNSDGQEDLFLWVNGARSEDCLTTATRPNRRRLLRFSSLRRLLGGSRFVVGDLIEVRSLREIEATLDANGCLDGLPFMPEMIPYCGKRFRIFRCVDKIYDYGGAKNLRSFHDAYLLTRVRCDGGEHNGCGAGCYIIWRSAWLKEAKRDGASAVTYANSTGAEQIEKRLVTEADGEGCYVCQYTELCAASGHVVSPTDHWQSLRPVVLGNFTFGAFLVAVMTRLFNRMQIRRSGAAYPFIGRTSAARSVPGNGEFQPGDAVRVRPVSEIAKTLDYGGKSAGLWFDRDMIRHCNRTFVVSRRVQRIIDDATGKMLTMRNPCIVLEGIDASGEFLRFCAQHDQPFWRESWLERIGGNSTEQSS